MADVTSDRALGLISQQKNPAGHRGVSGTIASMLLTVEGGWRGVKRA